MNEQKPNRAEFHQANLARACDQAQQYLAQREALGGRWLDWLAQQLYQLSPPEYASMVRRELARLSEQD